MTLIGKFQKGNDYAYLWSKGNYNYELASTVKSIVVLSGHTKEEALEYLAENGWFSILMSFAPIPQRSSKP